MTSGYTFVLTPIEPQVKTPYEVIPNHNLQKADKAQIDKIKSMLQRFAPEPFVINPYESNWLAEPGDKPEHLFWKEVPLPPENWRYWIIYFQGTNVELQELEYALSLMENDIKLGFEIMSLKNKDDSYQWNPQHLGTYFNESSRHRLLSKKITSVDLQLVSDCYLKLKSIPTEYSHIKRAFQRFDMLKSIPSSSELKVIGLFSIIETLLTHAPKNNDPTDSLARQIKHKIPLVRKRFQRPIDHKSIFENNINEDVLWSRLYGFRSKIVHGESADLSGDLIVLKDRERVVRFLCEIVKLLLIQSLNEPVLISDLKEC